MWDSDVESSLALKVCVIGQPVFGVLECRKSRFGEPTKDPSSRRYDIKISVRPKSPVQSLVARVGAQMRQIRLSWWPRWPALGYKFVP